jgi:hypothetical protein
MLLVVTIEENRLTSVSVAAFLPITTDSNITVSTADLKRVGLLANCLVRILETYSVG